MEFEILEDLIEHGMSSEYSLQERIDIFRLCGNCCQMNKKFQAKFLLSGGGPLMVDIGSLIIKREYDNDAAVSEFVLSCQAVIHHKVGMTTLSNVSVVLQS